MENKQMVHIASEIIALVGLTFYFNQKNKKLLGLIEDLTKKVQEQDDLIQKHDHIIKKMIEFMNLQNQKSSSPPILPEPSKIRKKSIKEVHTKHPLAPSKSEQPKVSFTDEVLIKNKSPQKIESEESDEESEESDLDAELAEELEELEIEEEIDLTGLKKRSK